MEEYFTISSTYGLIKKKKIGYCQRQNEQYLKVTILFRQKIRKAKCYVVLFNFTITNNRAPTYTSFSVGGGHESLFADTIIRIVGVHAIAVLANVRVSSFALVLVVANVRYLVVHSALGTHALEGSHGVHARPALANSRYGFALVDI